MDVGFVERPAPCHPDVQTFSTHGVVNQHQTPVHSDPLSFVNRQRVAKRNMDCRVVGGERDRAALAVRDLEGAVRSGGGHRYEPTDPGR